MFKSLHDVKRVRFSLVLLQMNFHLLACSSCGHTIGLREMNLFLSRSTKPFRFERIRGGCWYCFGFKSSSACITKKNENSTQLATLIQTSKTARREETESNRIDEYCDRSTVGDALSAACARSSSDEFLQMADRDMVARQGWIFKKDHNLLNTWQRRYAIVRHGCLIYYENGKAIGGDLGREIPLLNCEVIEKEDYNYLHGIRFAFAFVIHVNEEAKNMMLACEMQGQLVTYKGYSSYVFAANDAEDRSCWVRLLSCVATLS